MRSWQIFKIWGIPFKIHPYWFAILFLFSWSIRNQVILTSGDIYNTKEAWIIGFLTSFFLLSSLIFHEIFHTFVSLNQGVKIKKITFYFLGAILQIDKDCKTASGNIKISIVRPLLCLGTSLILFFISNENNFQEELTINIITRLSILYLLLGLLYLIPLGSLDGGNLLKSIIWYLSGSKNKGRIFLNKINLLMSFLILLLGIVLIFSLNFYYGFIFTFLGLFCLNLTKSESQSFKIENIVRSSKVSELKLKPLKKIDSNSNFVDFNKKLTNKDNNYDRYFFLTNDGRWDGFVDEQILKSVSIRKWDRTFIGDFKNPINSFKSVYIGEELWKTIEKIEETGDGFLLVLNAAEIPLGIIDRNNIGYFILKKIGLNLPNDILAKFKTKNDYPLGLQLPRIINLMRKRGDIE